VAFFLTDAPPDERLREAAAAGALSSVAGLSEQVERLLSSDVARSHLERAMFGYFDYPGLETLVLSPDVYPEWTLGLRTSMRREGQRFLERELWSAPLSALMSSRRTFVDAELAALYDVPFPPPGATLDADGFASIELPQVRSGILTQAAFLTARSGPQGPSVVRRGFQVTFGLACFEFSPPEDPGIVVEVEAMLAADLTEREKAQARMTEPQCSACHAMSDPYGLVLDVFDGIGRHRTADESGRSIDPIVMLPDAVGGATVEGAAGLGVALIESGRLATCVARGFAQQALGQIHGGTAPCLGDEKAARLSKVPEPTFAELLRHIALSPVFASRSAENP
jgi:hypothetical protein